MNLRDKSYSRDKRDIEAAGLLKEARELLAQIIRFHITSVDIGRLQPIADSGGIDKELAEARQYVERCDKLCAGIDKRGNK